MRRHEDALPPHLENGQIQPHPTADGDGEGAGGVDRHAGVDAPAVGDHRAHALFVGLDPRRPGAHVKAGVFGGAGEALGRLMGREPSVPGPIGAGPDLRAEPGPAAQDLVAGEAFGIGNAELVVGRDRGAHLVHHGILAGEKEVAAVVQVDFVSVQAGDRGEVLPDPDGLPGQARHGRFGELCPERLDGGRGGQRGKPVAHLHQHGGQTRF